MILQLTHGIGPCIPVCKNKKGRFDKQRYDFEAATDMTILIATFWLRTESLYLAATVVIIQTRRKRKACYS